MGLNLVSRTLPVAVLLCRLGKLAEQIVFGERFRSNQRSVKLFLRLHRVVFGNAVYFHEIPYLFGRGNLAIGDYCSFGEFTRIWNFDKIEIGDDFMAAAGLVILTGGHDPDTMRPKVAPVKIGKRVWCGANVSILPGVTIGDDAVVGAGSIVTADVPAATIVAGVPARKIRDVDLRKRSEDFFRVRDLIVPGKGT